mmetsp:Transcript_9871/g.36152  ORF Transcript_9871/g.36152 Transcript_9871/m.36152 type:complete len:215 (+) Transcript_9871:1311-1955(+)
MAESESSSSNLSYTSFSVISPSSSSATVASMPSSSSTSRSSFSFCRSHSRSLSICNTACKADVSSPVTSCSTWMTNKKSGIFTVRSEMARSSVDFPTPLRPTRPYFTPYVSASVPELISSCLPAYRVMPVTLISMFRFFLSAASGPVLMKKPNSSAVGRCFLLALVVASAAAFSASRLALASASSFCLAKNFLFLFLGGMVETHPLLSTPEPHD